MAGTVELLSRGVCVADIDVVVVALFGLLIVLLPVAVGGRSSGSCSGASAMADAVAVASAGDSATPPLAEVAAAGWTTAAADAAGESAIATDVALDEPPIFSVMNRPPWSFGSDWPPSAPRRFLPSSTPESPSPSRSGTTCTESAPPVKPVRPPENASPGLTKCGDKSRCCLAERTRESLFSSSRRWDEVRRLLDVASSCPPASSRRMLGMASALACNRELRRVRPRITSTRSEA